MNTKALRWTNKSVLNFAEGEDPIKKIENKAREIAIWAIDKGWNGPPYDPIRLADFLKTPVVPRDDIRDARTIPHGRKGSVIEFNPSAPRWRVRFSIAHEIAHTFFPDCRQRVRNRFVHTDVKGDDWQLEFLCNLAAAELLMPVGSFLTLKTDSLTIERMLSLKQEYDVSMEALLMRVAKLREEPCAVFFATRMEGGSFKDSYRLDYIVPSRSFSGTLTRGIYLPPNSVLSECISIGYTASGVERWSPESDRLGVECVGIPPLPGNIYPRVAGLLKPLRSKRMFQASNIIYVRGDALTPRGSRHKIIAHIVNDQSPTWGGKSFAASLRRQWQHVQDDFYEWALSRRSEFSLGAVRQCLVDASTTVVSMVAQRGYGPSPTPRIRYSALESCLNQLAEIASGLGATVHMPRIGAGNAGGAWPIIEELIIDNLLDKGIMVTVYSLPDRPQPVARDRFLIEVSQQHI